MSLINDNGQVSILLGKIREHYGDERLRQLITPEKDTLSDYDLLDFLEVRGEFADLHAPDPRYFEQVHLAEAYTEYWLPMLEEEETPNG